MKREDSKRIYEELFSDDLSKARAFDMLAEKYYYSNFGTASKSDIDVLMFSLYIEQILDKGQDDFSAYSDYTLSKQLGITQAKICNLKVKKELLYPYEKFDWKNALLIVSKNVIIEDHRIKLFIPDRNVYLEVKNVIETNGGFIDVSLTKNLLVVKQEYFLDLLVVISDEGDKKKIKKEIEKVLIKNTGVGFSEKAPIAKRLMEQTPDMVIGLLGECVPVFGGVIKCIGENILEAIRRK